MDFNKILNWLLVIIGIILIITIFFLFNTDNSNLKNATLELIGDKELTLYQGDEYQESGYNIIKEDNDTRNYQVNVINNLNTNIIGTYLIRYQLIYDNKVLDEEFRNIKVIQNPVTKELKITLNGNDLVYHWVKDDYVDSGATAYNGNENITNEIKVEGKVDVNKEGTYELKYTISKNGITKSVNRTVKVIDLKVSENVNYTKSQIELNITLEEFYYVTLPNGGTSYSSVINYPVSKNGSYTFTIYNKYGLSKKYVVNVASFDTKPPIGSCIANVSGGKTTVIVSASDESGIAKYKYNNTEYNTSTFTINGELSKVVVTVYDKYNNYTNLTCRVNKLVDNNMENITLSNTLTPCNSNWSKENQELSSAINRIGYKTRDAVVYAATYLAGFKYKVAYSWGGKSLDIGLNPRWGCEVDVVKETCTKVTGTNRCIYGMDCTGYTAWAFAQAGFDKSILRTSSQSTGMWGNFNASTHKYSFTRNQDKVNLIKPGDIVHTEGHVGMVIGTNSTQLKVANMVDGVKITYISKTNGKSVNGGRSFDNFVLFDDFFTMYGN